MASMPVSAVTEAGCGDRQLGVENRNTTGGTRIAASHLDVCLGLADQRERLRFHYRCQQL